MSLNHSSVNRDDLFAVFSPHYSIWCTYLCSNQRIIDFGGSFLWFLFLKQLTAWLHSSSLPNHLTEALLHYIGHHGHCILMMCFSLHFPSDVKNLYENTELFRWTLRQNWVSKQERTHFLHLKSILPHLYIFSVRSFSFNFLKTEHCSNIIAWVCEDCLKRKRLLIWGAPHCNAHWWLNYDPRDFSLMQSKQATACLPSLWP